jgi:GMP synthase (glutamine-hydrolysing)
MENEFVAILDFGSQYNQLIARRVRENKVYCEILPHDTPPEEMKRLKAKGIIMSGGPASVYAPGAPRCHPGIFSLGIPALGICYGMQLGCQLLGADVRPAPSREYGRTKCKVLDRSGLFESLPAQITVWMSHGDQVAQLSDDFIPLAETATCPYAAVKHRRYPFFGVQFHPEVTHTPRGSEIIRNFLYNVCRCSGDWRMSSFVERSIAGIRARVGKHKVVCGLSGGVDSSVVATLVHRAVGPQLSCIFVDNGVLRANEAAHVIDTFKNHFAIDLHFVDASERFLKKLKGVANPEQKRRIIGHEFVAVFKQEARKIEGVRFLAQGTLYPDVIESRSAFGGPSATIKTHHNVGGLPAELGFELVEPLRELFKDEVRAIAVELGLPDHIVWRQPFPGPGLAVRVIGEVTRERLDILRAADDIVLEEITAAGLYRSIGQSFAVLLPVTTVGVMGDERSYEHVVALRAVETTDFMTADWVHLPYDLLATISNRIINEVRGVNRVVYDVSSKPPSTIEWE